MYCIFVFQGNTRFKLASAILPFECNYRFVYLEFKLLAKVWHDKMSVLHLPAGVSDGMD